ncbi:MAG TPA: single-stranded-DNA-specific exonuclease RecJ [Thermoleophilaceae bacterium]|nr:single-stranded-DNA-specific exonuclease RecJ [Thermoleophilaceae bacterium]
MLPEVSGWACAPYKAGESVALAAELGLSPHAAAILSRRGLGDAEAARRFLAADERHAPELLAGMGEACAAIRRHVETGSRVVVFGDYDVDGVCSTAIVLRALRAIGADPAWRLPSRDEGYGLSAEVVRELVGQGAGLIVTVDCGVTAVAEVELAQELGVEVVVTDHHRPGATLPGCPVVHPALGGYPFEHLCGAAVALKLSEALRRAAGLDPAGADRDLDLAGLATLCDMVPLVGENRRIARAGLAELARTRKQGLRALMAVAQLDPADLDERAAGFRLGPRINAAGRLKRADAALELLLTEDRERGDEIARELDGLNHDRREAEQRILGEAERLCLPQLAAAAIVVAGEGWHPGVVGIVASRLVERHRRPCVAIALDGERGRGSGRSIDPYDLHAGLGAASEHLLRHGGHRMAAGLEIAADSVDAFRAALARHAGEALAPGDLLPIQEAHAVVPAGALTLGLAEELDRLAPFGAGNPAPVLMVPAGRVEHVTAMGEQGDHARFTLTGGAARARGVAFRTSQRDLADAGAADHDVAVALERNRWNGSVEARVVLRSLCPTRPGVIEDLAPEPSLASAVEQELSADPGSWWPVAAGQDSAGLSGPATSDRRGEGLAGLAGDLLTSGESVAILVTDVARRRAGLEAMVAGMATGPLPVLAWEAFGAAPGVAAELEHVIALDPPPTPDGLALLGRMSATTHLAWGAPERAFTLASWRDRLQIRPALVDLWRALDAAGELAGRDLEVALRGGGQHPRDARHCGRLVRVLGELGLARWDSSAGPRLLRGHVERTDLSNSHANRAYAARLAATERYLSGAERDVPRAAAV